MKFQVRIKPTKQEDVIKRHAGHGVVRASFQARTRG